MATQARHQAKKTKKEKTPRGPVNVWKWVSLILIGLILGGGIFLGSKIFTQPNNQLGADVSQADEPVFNVDLTKQQANRIVAYSLKHYLKNDEFQYSFKFTDQAVLGGKFKFLGSTVPFTLNLDPYVMENGDIQLKAESLSIGALPIPISQVMSFIGNDYKVPNWISLDTKKETITLHLRKYKMKNGMSVRANQIDLDKNQINFSVYLPE
jgi:Uncharacterized protein conserved in bacteria